VRGREKLVVAAVAVAILSWPNAKAVIITDYSSASAWQTAVGSYTTEDFNDATLNLGLSVSTVNGSISGGLWNDKVVQSGASTTWMFTNPINAWGADFDFTPGDWGGGINVSLDLLGNGVVLAHTMLNPSLPDGNTWPFVGFYGLRADMSFDRVVLTGGSQKWATQESYTLDNMKYSSIPEPTTWSMLVLGVVALLGTLKLRRG
jgi:hypothetical protein